MQSYRTNFNDPNNLTYVPHPSSSRPLQTAFTNYPSNPFPRNGPPLDMRNPSNQINPGGYGKIIGDQQAMVQGSNSGNPMIIPLKNQIPYANPYARSQQQQSQKEAEQVKYAYRPSIEDNESLVSGYNYENMNNFRNNYRRSESVSKAKTQDYDKDASSKGYTTTYRFSTDVKEQQCNKGKNNQYQTQNYTIQQNSDPLHFKTKQENSYLSKFEEYSKYKAPTNYNPKQYNFNSYLTDIKPSPSTYTELPVRRKESSQYERGMSLVSKQSKTYKDLGQSSKMSDKNEFNKTLNSIGKDIQSLKQATKQSKDVVERQLSKNTYLTKLLEKRASRNFEEALKSQGLSSKNEAKDHIVSKEVESQTRIESDLNKEKESQAYRQLEVTNEELRVRVIQLQKQLQSRMKEGNDKSKQIWDKSKTLIEKNKNIDTLKNELRQIKKMLEVKETSWSQQEMKLKDKIENQEKEIIEKNQKIVEIQNSAKEVLNIFQKEKEEKNKKIEELQKEILSQNSSIEALTQKIEKFNQKIQELTKQKTKYASKNQQLRESQSQSNIELFQIKTSLVSKDKQILLKQQQIEQLKEKLLEQQKNIEAILLAAEDEKKKSQTQNSEIQLIESPKEKEVEEDGTIDLPQVSRQDLERIISCFEAREKELAHLLLEQQTEHDHDKIIRRLKELLEAAEAAQRFKEVQKNKVEEHQLYKMHHDYLQKKCQEMNRELKRAGTKLLSASNEVHQSWRLINQCNSQIVLLNLGKLNLKYLETSEQIDDELIEPVENQEKQEIEVNVQ